MKEVHVSSIEEFWNQYRGKSSQNSCIVSDIDSVWFKGIFDWRAWVSLFSEKRIKLIREISDTDNDFLLFTNRNFPGLWPGGYVSQLQSKLPDSKWQIYKNSEEFMNRKDFNGLGIVRNAQKPTEPSLSVLKWLLKKYDNLTYIGGRDFPWSYKDGDVIVKLQEELEEQLLNKLIFVDVKK